MTTEQKAKKYDEVLEWMRELYPGLHGATKEDAEHYFPELIESKDKRIIEQIKFAVMQMSSDREDTKKECLAWLEKQKEQKPIAINQDEKEFLADEITAFLCNYDKEFDGEDPVPSEVAEHFYLLGKQAQEQKPAEWSEEDKAIIGCIVCCLDGQFVTEAARKQCLEWFNKHRKDFLNQPKQELSEEDEEMLNSCISSIEESKENRYAYRENDGDTSYDREIAWLKSLKDRGNFPKSNTNSPSEWSEKDEKMRKNIIWVLESYVSHTTCESNPSLTVSYPTYYKEVDWLKSLSSQLHWKPSEEQMQALWEIYQGGEAQAPIASLYDDLKKLMEE